MLQLQPTADLYRKMLPGRDANAHWYCRQLWMPEARAQRPETRELAVDQMGIPSPKMVVRSRVVTIMKTYEDGCQSEIFP